LLESMNLMDLTLIGNTLLNKVGHHLTGYDVHISQTSYVFILNMEENNSAPSNTKSSHSQMCYHCLMYTHMYTNTKYFGQWQYFCVQLKCHCTSKFSIIIFCLHRKQQH
jgi:hypothetical protein